MNYIKVPNSDVKLYAGSIIILARFPSTHWVLNNGWYTYDGKQYNGWYLCSIPAETILPLNESDLKNVTILSTGCNGDSNKDDICNCKPPKPPEFPDNCCPCPPPYPPPYPPCPPPGPKPPICPEDNRHIKPIVKYYKGVNYVKGQLVYLIEGVLYQVATNFRSSYKFETLDENLDADVQSGNLAPLPSMSDINKIQKDMNSLSTEVSNVKIRKYLVGFKNAFGTDTPTNQEVKHYLDGLGIEPSESIYLKNTDVDTITSDHTFTFYKNSEGNLVLYDETVVIAEGGFPPLGNVIKDFTISKSEDDNDSINISKTNISIPKGDISIINVETSYEDLGIASSKQLDNLKNVVTYADYDN